MTFNDVTSGTLMGHREGALTLILLLFCSLWVVLPSVDAGKATFWSTPELPSPIYIRSDGSIEPPSSIQKIGDTYMLTRDIDNYIEVQRDHIVIDGNGFSITQTPINTSGFMIPAGFYPGICLNNRINVTVQNVKIHDCISGITFQSATNITATNNTIMGISEIAIFGGSSSGCTVSQNDIMDNYVGIGILIINSTHIHISENNIKRNSIGVNIAGSGYPNHYLTITQNNISDNTDAGVRIYEGSKISVVGNNIVDNSIGLYVSFTNCTVHHNNFVDNVENVDSNSCWGPWDDGREGNYWSDYNGTDQDGDGIGDTPHIVETPWTWIEPTTNIPITNGVNAQDNYPLIGPITIFDAGTWEGVNYNVNVISNSTVSGITFYPEGARVQFSLMGETGTTGFCRVTIPKELLSAEDDWVVLVDDKSVTPSVNEDESNTYLYFTYRHSIKTVEIIGTTAIPEFPSWIILPFVITVMSVVIIYRRILSKPNGRRS